MQIHEITLREAALEPLDPKKIMATARPTKFDWGPKTPTRVGTEPAVDPAAFKAKDDALAAKQAQYQAQANQGAAQARARVNPAPQAPQRAPASGAGAFSQMAQQLQPKTGTTLSSTGGTITQTPQGVVHTANLDNPNPRTSPPTQQQLWDREYRKLQNQFPGLTPQQYQKAMTKRGYTQTATTQATPSNAVPQQVAPQPTARPIVPKSSAPVAPATPTPAAPAQYPPITLGTGPKAQTYVNKGQGYVDNKTNKPMPPAILKALNLQ